MRVMTVEAGAEAAPSPPIAWVVPGPLRQVTGGYLYDARVVDGLRERSRPVGVINLQASRWPLDVPAGRRLTRVLTSRRWGAVVADELAHPALAAAILTGGLRRALAGAPLVLLVHHLRCSEPAPRLLRTVARLVETAALRTADVVVCTSETTAGIVGAMARDGVPVRVVRPGWDTQEKPTLAGAMNRAPHGQTDAPGHPEHSEGSHSPVRYSGSCAGPSGDPSQAQDDNLRLPLSTAVGRDVGVADVRAAQRTGGGASLRLLLVGHWTPRKGILGALAALRRAPAGVTLDLVGEPDRDLAYAERVRAALRDPLLAGRVRVHGRVSDDDLTALYAATDALILPSTYEGYGMVLAEALAAGLPIVATRVGAVPAVVRDGLEAELVAPGDVAGLTRAIERLARDPAERRRRSALARERAASLPTWQESIDAFAAILRSLPDRRPCEPRRVRG
jgi:glycosyltransferase involved in cell wall biosynthesis